MTNKIKFLLVLICSLFLLSSCNKTEWEDPIPEYPCNPEADAKINIKNYIYQSKTLVDWNMVFHGDIRTNGEKGQIQTNVELIMHNGHIDDYSIDYQEIDFDEGDTFHHYDFNVPESLYNTCKYIRIQFFRADLDVYCNPIENSWHHIRTASINL